MFKRNDHLSFFGWESNKVIAVTTWRSEEAPALLFLIIQCTKTFEESISEKRMKASQCLTHRYFFCTLVFSLMLVYHVAIRILPFVIAATSVASLYSSVDKTGQGCHGCCNILINRCEACKPVFLTHHTISEQLVQHFNSPQPQKPQSAIFIQVITNTHNLRHTPTQDASKMNHMPKQGAT